MDVGEYELALCEATTRFLARSSADVHIFPDADNLVRPRDPGEATHEHSFVVEVEGVPNLVHEFAHIVLLGRVAKDHGTNPADIPFDMESATGRRLLFEELTCCAVSCAYFPGPAEAMFAWFREQVGIQGLFFGCEDPDDFVLQAGRVCEQHRPELLAIEERGFCNTAAALSTGPPTDKVRDRLIDPVAAVPPRHDVRLAQLWPALNPS